jgi:hypothetical protein
LMRRTCGEFACVLFFCTQGRGCGPRTRHSLRPLFSRVTRAIARAQLAAGTRNRAQMERRPT